MTRRDGCLHRAAGRAQITVRVRPRRIDKHPARPCRTGGYLRTHPRPGSVTEGDRMLSPACRPIAEYLRLSAGRRHRRMEYRSGSSGRRSAPHGDPRLPVPGASAAGMQPLEGPEQPVNLGGQLVWIGPDVGNPGDRPGLIQLEKARPGLGAILASERSPACRVVPFTNNPLYRNMPIARESLHVEPDVGIPGRERAPRVCGPHRPRRRRASGRTPPSPWPRRPPSKRPPLRVPLS